MCLLQQANTYSNAYDMQLGDANALEILQSCTKPL